MPAFCQPMKTTTEPVRPLMGIGGDRHPLWLFLSPIEHKAQLPLSTDTIIPNRMYT